MDRMWRPMRGAGAAALACVGWLSAAASGQDPIYEDVKLLRPPELDGSFGVPVVISGRWLFATASFANVGGDDAGAVVAFTFDGENELVATQILSAPNPVDLEHFGRIVDLKGDLAVFGRPDMDSVVIFRLDPKTQQWVVEDEILGPAPDEKFGFGVGIDGDVLIVGAPDVVYGGGRRGRAYVYRHILGEWTFETALDPTAPTIGGGFSARVDVDGDRAIAAQEIPDLIHVFRYERGAWSLEQEIGELIPNGTPPIVLSGNHIVQGDPSQGVFTANYYHYDEGSQTWSLLAEHLNAFSVSLSGDVSVTGGHPNFPTARVRWFDEKKDSWGPGQGIELAASDGLDVKFGSSVAVDGDFCAVADEANKEPTSPGAVYVYFLADCNSNGIPDSVDILDGTSLDLDGTGVPDECEDCDGDGIPNVEEIEMGSIDCDDDQIPDECEDPDGNGINDECDCNDNDVLDGEDIENGTSLDCNLNGVPDECEDFFAGEARWLGESDLQPDGLFRLHTNWDPDFPGADGSAMFDLGFDGAYTVFFDKDASNVAATVRSDEVVFNLGGFSYELTDAQDHSLIIALDAGDQASLTLLSGVLISREARIGNGEGAVGAVIVDGPGTVWSQPMLTDELCVGCSGTGSLIVSNGATVDSGIAVVGLESSSAADVLITGADSIWQVGLPLIVDNGTLAVEDGGTIHVGLGDLVILDDAMLVGDGNVEVPNGRVINLGGMHPTQMLMDGDFRQCPDGDEPDLGVLFVDITAGGHDHLTVTGSADVCGGLVVDLIGFEPEIGATFPFLQAGSTSGVFDVALFDGLSDERFLTLAYPLGPGGEISIVVETLASLFGFGEVIHPEDLAGVPTDIAIADLDDDGDQDVAVTIPVGRGEAGAVLVLENGGTVDGVWQGWAKSHAFTVGELPTAIVAAPLDGDDLIDLAVTNGADHDVSILLNAGAGIGFDIIEYASNGTGPAALAVEAFDATTGLDLAIVHAGDDTLTVLINQGDGSFAAGRTLSLPAGSLASAVDPADVDNDKCTDVVAALSGLDQVAVLQGDGAGGFTLGPDGLMDVGAEPVQLVVTDLDGDGADDVVTANAGNGTISVLASNPAGLLDPAVDLPIGESSSWIAAFDAEGDGDDDLAVVTDDADLGRLVRVIRNDSMPEQLALTVLPDDQAVGQEPVLVAGGQIDGLPGDDLVSITTASGAGPGMFPQAQVQPALPEMIVICPADVTGDMNVDVQDLVEVVLAWGPCPAPCTPDVNDDGVVDVQDLVEIVLAWGPCSP